MEILTTHDLAKSYKKHRVVNNVNIHVEEGDIYGFVGENGAGKTTIIRLVTGLANPTSGTYSLFGVDYKNKKICDQRAKIGGIVESVSLITSLNALENLKFQCLTAGVDKTNEELIELLILKIFISFYKLAFYSTQRLLIEEEYQQRINTKGLNYSPLIQLSMKQLCQSTLINLWIKISNDFY